MRGCSGGGRAPPARSSPSRPSSREHRTFEEPAAQGSRHLPDHDLVFRRIVRARCRAWRAVGHAVGDDAVPRLGDHDVDRRRGPRSAGRVVIASSRRTPAPDAALPRRATRRRRPSRVRQSRRSSGRCARGRSRRRRPAPEASGGSPNRASSTPSLTPRRATKGCRRSRIALEAAVHGQSPRADARAACADGRDESRRRSGCSGSSR